KLVEGQEFLACFGERTRDGGAELRPLACEGGMGLAGGEPVLSVGDVAIVATKLGPRVHWAGLFEVPELMHGAALHLGAWPFVERLAQPLVSVDDQERRRRETTTLQIENRRAPVRGRLAG